MMELQQIERNNPPGNYGLTGAWPILITICCGFFALNLDYFLSVSSVLSEPAFLSGFGIMILQIGIVSALAGGVGLAAELLLRHDGCTQSMIRFLRLDRWLPFFVVWAAPIWWIRWSKSLNMPLWTEPLFQLVIAMFPTVMFTACYYYLSGRHTLQLSRRAAAFAVLTPILSDALLLSFLLQVNLYANGWQWFAPLDFVLMARPSATVVLVGGFSFFLHWIGRSTVEKTAAMHGVTILR